MVTIEDLSNVINNDVLHDLFIQRNEEVISHVSKEDAKNLELLYAKQKQSRQILSDSLSNYSLDNKEQIIKNVENHIEISAEVNGYFDEKLYKSGVIDGLALVLDNKK